MFKHKKGNHYCDTPKSKPVQKVSKRSPREKNNPMVNDIIILMFKIVTS